MAIGSICRTRPLRQEHGITLYLNQGIMIETALRFRQTCVSANPPAPAAGSETLRRFEIEGVRPIVHVLVRDNNVDQALRALKKKMQREGVFREMKLRRSYEKPSERRAREKAEAVRRHRKLLRKRLEREGY